MAKGEACIHCGATAVVKYGKVSKAQRYYCKDCHKTFNTLNFSSLSYSKLPLDLWAHYTQCLISGYGIRKSTKTVSICVKTSFYMRHKFSDCIRAYIGVGHVESIVELDDTMVAESFKGNHKKSGFILPHESRKRGGEIHTHDISNKYVCMVSVIDRHGNVILEDVCKGRFTHSDLKKLFTNHINSINSLHNRFKQWLADFKGVSTNYLSNYLAFFKLIEMIKVEKKLFK